MEAEKKCQCGPGCTCPECTCPPGCPGKCGPKGFPPKFGPPPFPFPIARVLEPAPSKVKSGMTEVFKT